MHSSGIQLSSPVVIDYLYAAARDTAAFLDIRCEGRWFAHWGTALGAVRDGGLIPYDRDVDFVPLPRGNGYLTEALNQTPPKQTWSSFAQQRGRAWSI